jgi:hypothetical protein
VLRKQLLIGGLDLRIEFSDVLSHLLELPVTLKSAPRHAAIRQAKTLENGTASRSKPAPSPEASSLRFC